ncbi:o-succinylbenzoate--CoA ligase [Halobacillus campisalis]|uniref:2-succinylbenzoate--CoA ligase n=1 Tax=Halobacillus campisalis TaxID=435909 RepID=A0ABW2K5L5_9BACI|nr:o-succinylbenzoate--CoA ligase [Halobacillus campisalis]
MTEIPHWLDKQAQLHPNAHAIESPDEVLTFRQLQELSQQIAGGLYKLGVQEGDHIAILSGNHINFAAFIHAASYIGAIVVCLNTRLTEKELQFQLRDAKVSQCFADNDNYMKGARALKEMSDAISITNVDEIPRVEKETYEQFKEFIDMDEIFTMMYTSGTTGNPKAVMHTYGNHWFSAVASSLNLGLDTNDKWLACLPLFHVGGFSLLIKNVVYGMPIVLLERFDLHLVHKQIKNNQVTLISIVTVMLQRMLKEKPLNYPSSFRGALLGGGPVPKTLLHEADSENLPVFQSYGLTETSSQIATLSPSDSFRKLGSAGKALGPATLKVFKDGTPAPPNVVGEIHVKGPMVAKGYFGHPSVNDDYFATGDLGYLDEEGFLFVVDRVKDMLISGGENVYPAEIESVLTQIKGVQEAGVTGTAHKEWGEVPIAFIVKSNLDEVTKEQVTAFCQNRLASFKVPHTIHFVSELPRNASNKLVRRKLKDLIDGGGYE